MSTTRAGTTFKLRTPAHIKTCHITGSWDKYSKRYPMRQDTSAGPGWWCLTLKFGSSMPPGRYWYYYILDGYFESHDPNKPTCIEPGRKITLNILDYISSRDSSPSSHSYSSGSSRFPSPASTNLTTPSSASSKRSGMYFEGGSPRGHSRSSSKSSKSSSRERSPPYYNEHGQLVSGKRTPSPHRRNMEMAHLVHPKPRNPMEAHKLTLDTAGASRYSIVTTAATTAGDSPNSASSSRSNSSLASGSSICSACSGSTWSNGSSPTTPMCTCPWSSQHRKDCQYDSEGEYSDGSCFTEESEGEEEEGVYRVSMASHRKSWRQSRDEELAYRLERGLRM